MANQDIEFIVSPIDYSGAVTTEVIADGKQFMYNGNDDVGSDVVYSVIGDGVTTLANLPKYLPQDGTGWTSIDASNRSVIPLSITRLTDDNASLYLGGGKIFKQDATNVSFDVTDLTIFRLYSPDGTDYVDLLSETYTPSALQVYKDQLRFVLSVTGGFSGWGNAAGSVQIAGQLKIELS